MNVFYMKQFINHRLKSCYILAGFIGLLPCSANTASSGILSPETISSSQQITPSNIVSWLRPYAPYIGAGLAVAGIGAIASYGLAKQDDNNKVKNFTRLASDEGFYFFRETRLSRLCRQMTLSEKISLVNRAMGSFFKRENIFQALQRNGLLNENVDLTSRFAYEGDEHRFLASIDTKNISLSTFATFAAKAHHAYSGILDPYDRRVYRDGYSAAIIEEDKPLIINTIKICAFKGVTQKERDAFFTNTKTLVIALSSQDISVDEIKSFFPEDPEQAQACMQRLFNNLLDLLGHGNVQLTAEATSRIKMLCAQLQMQPQGSAFLCNEKTLMAALSSQDFSVDEIKSFFPESPELAQEYIRRLFNSLGNSQLRHTGTMLKLWQLCIQLHIQPQQLYSTMSAASSNSSSCTEWPCDIFSRSYSDENNRILAIKLCAFKEVTPAIREAFFSKDTLRAALQSDQVSAEDIIIFFPQNETLKIKYFLRMLQQLASEKPSPYSGLPLWYPNACRKLLALADALGINIWQIHPHMRGLESHDILVEDFIKNSSYLEDKKGLVELTRYFANKAHSSVEEKLPYYMGTLEKCLYKLNDLDYHSVLLNPYNNGKTLLDDYVLIKLNHLTTVPDTSQLAQICNRMEQAQFDTFLSRISDDPIFIDAAWNAMRILRKSNILQIQSNMRLGKILAICNEKEKDLLNLAERAKLVFPITASPPTHLSTKTYTCPADFLDQHYPFSVYTLLDAVLKQCDDTNNHPRTITTKKNLLLDIIRRIKQPSLFYERMVVETFNKLSIIGIKPNARLYPYSQEDNRTFFQDYILRTDDIRKLNEFILPLCALLTDVEFNDEMVDLQATPHFKKWYERNKDWLQKHPATNAAIDRLIIAGENSLRLQQSVVSMLLQELEQPSSNAATSSAEQG